MATLRYKNVDHWGDIIKNVELDSGALSGIYMRSIYIEDQLNINMQFIGGTRASLIIMGSQNTVEPFCFLCNVPTTGTLYTTKLASRNAEYSFSSPEGTCSLNFKLPYAAWCRVMVISNRDFTYTIS